MASSFHPSSLLLSRRFLSLCALLFWQGGFLFYAAVVIPVAGRVLEGQAPSAGADHRRGHRLAQRRRRRRPGPVAMGPGFLGRFLPAAEQGPRRLLGGVVSHPGGPVRPALLDGSARPAGQAGPSDPTPLPSRTACTSAISAGAKRGGSGLPGTGGERLARGRCATRQDERSYGWRRKEKKGRDKKVPPLASSASPSHRSRHTAEQ